MEKREREREREKIASVAKRSICGCLEESAAAVAAAAATGYWMKLLYFTLRMTSLIRAE